MDSCPASAAAAAAAAVLQQSALASVESHCRGFRRSQGKTCSLLVIANICVFSSGLRCFYPGVAPDFDPAAVIALAT